MVDTVHEVDYLLRARLGRLRLRVDSIVTLSQFFLNDVCERSQA
jgi:hypothetical protein